MAVGKLYLYVNTAAGAGQVVPGYLGHGWVLRNPRSRHTYISYEAGTRTVILLKFRAGNICCLLGTHFNGSQRGFNFWWR